MQKAAVLAVALLLVGMAGLSVSMTSVMAASVTPVLVDPWTSGNAEVEAAQAGTYAYAYKFEPWNETASNSFMVTYAGNTITITADDGYYFNWTATLPINAVIVVAANKANVFYYDPAATSDTGLYAPINPNNNKLYGISHVTFCWNGSSSPSPLPSAPEFGLPAFVMLSLAVVGLLLCRRFTIPTVLK